MKKLLVFIIATSIIVSFVLGMSITAYAQTTSIPRWIKNTALLWGQRQISDNEFINAIQWLVDNGMIKLPSTQQSSSQTSAPSTASVNNTPAPTQQVVFAPCSSVDISVPSDCLGHYLPSPSDIGSQWISQNGQSIPLSMTPSPMITQYVHQDFENVHVNPQETFDVWIEEWQSPNCAYVSTADCTTTSSAEQAVSAFKTDEKLASSASKFVGNPQSNDAVFSYIDQEYGQFGYHMEFIVGTVIVKIDGMGASQSTMIADTGTIGKTILNKMSP